MTILNMLLDNNIINIKTINKTIHRTLLYNKSVNAKYFIHRSLYDDELYFVTRKATIDEIIDNIEVSFYLEMKEFEEMMNNVKMTDNVEMIDNVEMTDNIEMTDNVEMTNDVGMTDNIGMINDVEMTNSNIVITGINDIRLFRNTYYPRVRWDCSVLSDRDDISLSFLIEYFDIKNNQDMVSDLELTWNWNCISLKLTQDEYDNNKDLPFTVIGLICNKNLKLNDRLSLFIKYYCVDKDIKIVNNKIIHDFIMETKTIIDDELALLSLKLPFYIIKKNLNIEWDYKSLSMNDTVPFKFIKENLDKNWDISYISQKVNYKDFTDNPDFPWDYIFIVSNIAIPTELLIHIVFSHNEDVSKNYLIGELLNNEIFWEKISKYITYKELLKYYNIINNKLSYLNLSKNCDIPLEYVINNLDKGWCWDSLSVRIDIKEIIKYPELPWDYKWVSINYTITYDFIIKNLDKLPIERLSFLNFHSFIDSEHYKRSSSNRLANNIIKDEKYCAKVFNPKRMLSYMSIYDINEMISDHGWTNEEFLNSLKMLN